MHMCVYIYAHMYICTYVFMFIHRQVHAYVEFGSGVFM